MTYLLSLITMFALVYYLTKEEIPAVFSAVAYAFSAYHLAHYMHPTLYNIQWLPLFILSLFILKDRKTLFYIITASLMLAVVTYADAYYGFFATIIFLVFAIYKRLKVKTVVIFSLLSLLLMTPFILWSRILWIDRLNLIVSYQASWGDYIYPFGQNSIENILYIPPTLILIALFGIKHCDKFFVILLLLALILSLSSPILPIFRATTRFGLLVILCVSVLSGYGILAIKKGK